MKRGLSRSHRILIALVLLSTVLGVLITLWPKEEVYAEYPRPDGHYRIIVYRRLNRIGMMPGQAADSPGRAVLVDATGKPLRETKLEMVQLIDAPEWGEKSVSVRTVLDWPLPD